MNNSPSKPTKVKKTKGPLRTGLLGTLSVIGILGAVYVLVFLDLHLRLGLQWGLGSGNGAEANVRSLKTSLLVPSLRIEGIELTDPGQPERNRVSIGKVEFILRWDALLRGKVVIDRVAVLDLGLQTPRKSRGWVSPPSKPDPNSFAGRLMAKVEDTADTSLKRAFALLGGFNPMEKIGKVDAKHAKALIENLQKDLAAKQQAWNASLKAMPTAETLSQLQSKIAAVQGGQIAALPGLIAEAQAKVAAVNDGSKAVTEGIGAFDRSIKSIDDAVAKDRAEAEAALALPKLDGSAISKDLLKEPVAEQLKRSGPLVSKLEPFLSKASEPKKVPPPSRPERSGRKFEFGRPNSYPAFWLKLAEFSGEAEASVQGKITDLTSDPKALGVPARVDLRGDFPRQGVKGIYVRASVDARQAFSASAELGADSIGVGDLPLLNSPDLTLALNRVAGAVAVKGSYAVGRGIDFTARLSSSQFDPLVSGGNALATKIVTEALRSTRPIYGQVQVRGSFENPELGLETNLAAALLNGLRGYISKELDQARQQLEKKIRQEVGDRQAALTQQYQTTKAGVEREVNARKQQAEAAVRAGEQKLREAQAAADAAKNKIGDELKKRLPF